VPVASCLETVLELQAMANKIDIETREFRIEDYDAAIELWKRVEGLDVAEGDDRETIRRFLERNRGLSRIAIAGSTTIGAVLCGHDGRRGYIYHLAVDRKFQGRGIGWRLMEECLAGLKRVGLERVNLLVGKDNSRGRDFWKSCGWEELDGALAMGRDVQKIGNYKVASRKSAR
jgi:ribosomal protein S18 acetylase RimI-like enzyme